MKTLKERLRDGEIVFGGTVTEHLRPSVVKAYVNAGFDFIFMENEHASFEPARLADFVLCARDNGLTVVSKLGDLSRAETARLLEMGVMGIQLPRTETADDMRTLLDYIKYPPVGSRASATGYGNSDYGKVDKSVWYKKMNADTFVVAHFETRAGAENAQAVLGVDGIDICFIGSSDLSLSYGIPGQYQDPGFLATVKGIFDEAARRDVIRGIVATNYDDARHWIDQGVQYFECHHELDFIRTGAANAMAELNRAREAAAG
jgi:2-keto-3-deoxy-L-rhamnonate aldolase RhmA